MFFPKRSALKPTSIAQIIAKARSGQIPGQVDTTLPSLADAAPAFPIADLRIAITGLSNLPATLIAGEADAAISLIDPVLDIQKHLMVCRFIDQHLLLKFDESSYDNSSIARAMAAISEIFEFVPKLPTQTTLVIHCHHGRSRSVAASIAVSLVRLRLLYPTVSIDQHIESVSAFLDRAVPDSMPDLSIIKALDDIFMTQGKLFTLAIRAVSRLT